MNNVDFKNLELLSQKLKLNMLKTIDNAQTGHLGACCSSNELLATLYFTDILEIDTTDAKNPNRDYVLIRGHLGPLRYNLFSMLGWMKPEEMMHYREFGSRLHGHEDMRTTPGVDITPSGSLGMVLSYAVGARYSFKIREGSNRIFCFLGDGEEQEGNVSEAARHATQLELDGLIAIIDKNNKQLSTETKNVDGKCNLQKIWEGYGWDVLDIHNGHDVREIYSVYKKAVNSSSKGPVCIIAHTTKGNSIKGASEHYNGYHVYHHTEEDNIYNSVPIREEIERLSKLLYKKTPIVPRRVISRKESVQTEAVKFSKIKPAFSDLQETAYDYLEEYLAKLSQTYEGRGMHILTADYPPRNLIYDTGKFSIPNMDYCNIGVREQHLLSMAHGISTVETNKHLLILCGDAFLYRFADQLNVLAQSDDNVVLFSVQAGFSGAKNGLTHQSSGQPGLIATMPGIRMLEPSSKRDMFYALNTAFTSSGPTYIRTHKLKTPFDYDGFQNYSFYEVRTRQAKEKADLTLISNGMVISDAIYAAKQLYDDDGIYTRVVNVLNPKETYGIAEVVEEGKPLFIFYNGNPSVLANPISKELLKSKKLPSKIIEQGFEIGTTGSVGDLMKHYKLDWEGITEIIRKELLKKYSI